MKSPDASKSIFSPRLRTVGWLVCPAMIDTIWCSWQARHWKRWDLIGQGIFHIHLGRAVWQFFSWYGALGWLIWVAVIAIARFRRRGLGSRQDQIEVAVVAGLAAAAYIAMSIAAEY